MTSMMTGSVWGRGFAAVSILAIAVAAPAHAQEAMHAFDIPAQPLSRAIAAFARQSRAPVLAPSALTRGKMSVAVKGVMTAADALQTLTSNAAVSVTRRGDGALLVSARQEEQDPKGSLGTADDSENGNGRDVVVTGSNIRGGNPESPVITITRKDIDRSGYSTAADLIKNLPQSSPGGQNATVRGSPNPTSGGNNGSISSVNLRGLGSDATLTLVDGRRLAYGGLQNGVDISSIPFGAIERVEVLTDGASSIYGSDAVGGVVNFILRKRFDGILTTARTGTSTDGGGSEYQLNQLAGTSWSNGSIMASYEYYQQEPIYTINRSFSRNAPTPNSLVPGQRKHSGFASFRQEITPDLTFKVNGFHTDRTARNDASTATAITKIDAYVRQYGVNPQLEWKSGSWVATIAIDRARHKQDYNGTNTSRSSGASSTNRSVQTNSITNYEAQASGSVFAMPGGDAKIAVGGGYREEALLARIGSAASGVTDGVRSIAYGYGEIRIPVVSSENDIPWLRSLDLSASGRFESYSDFGNNFSPKVGVSYKPIADLTLRATWSRAFKAPTLYQYVGERGLTIFTASALAVTAPSGSVIGVRTGANPDLEPETATSLTAGFDYTPIWASGAKLSFTYFDIRYKNRIGVPTAAVRGIYDNPLYINYIDKNLTAGQYLSVANSVSYISNLAGNYSPSKVIAIYNLESRNLFRQKISGIDVTGNYDFSLGDAKANIFGNMSFLKIRQQNLPTLPETTITGTIFNPSKFRARAGVQVQGEIVGGSFIVNHVGSEIDNSNSFNVGSPAKDVRVSSHTTLDTQLVFGSTQPDSPLEGYQLSFAVQNLLNTKPPRINPDSGLSGYPGIGYDSSNYSAVGRYVSVTVSKRW